MSMHIIYYTNIRSQTIITSTVNSLIHEYFPILIHISIQLFKKHTKFLKTIEKNTWNYTDFHTFTQETYKISEHYSKIREKKTNFHTITREKYKCLTKYMKKYTLTRKRAQVMQNS